MIIRLRSINYILVLPIMNLNHPKIANIKMKTITLSCYFEGQELT